MTENHMDIDLPDGKPSLPGYQGTMNLQSNILMQLARDIKEELVNHIDDDHSTIMEIKTESESFRKELDTFRQEPETFRQEPETFSQEPETFSQEPETFSQEPETFSQEPETFNQEPETFNQESETFNQEPETFRQETEIFRKETEAFGNEPETYRQGSEQYIQEPETQSKDIPENPFENVQLEIKQEINFSLVLETESTDLQSTEDKTDTENLPSAIPNSDVHSLSNTQFEVKKEGQESIVSYDFPSFDGPGSNSNENETTDVMSIDSFEATALGNVEACLQEEINIKYENDGNYAESEKVEFNHTDVKVESDLTLTDTHLIRNSVISPDIKPPTFDGLPKDAVVKLPGTQLGNEDMLSYNMKNNADNFKFNSITREEFEGSNNFDNDLFQLNSITGNVLSLEQEAYGLLKAKKRMDDKREKPYVCSECPKAYTSKKSLRNHWDVHRTIERRAMGVLKGMKTRKENQKKGNKVRYEIVPEVQINNKTESQSNSVRGMKIRREIKKMGRAERTKDKETQKIVPQDQKGNQIKKEGYECTCGKIFRRRSRMETCLRSHNLFESVPICVSCVTCSKSFGSKAELSSHRKRLHRKRFPCKFCPTDYETRKELFKHLQIHQKVQLIEYKVISEVMKSKKKLRCFMCSKTWSELSELKSHVMNDHTEPYICPHCKNTFTKIIDFGNHTKTYHPEVEGQSVLDVLEAFSRLIKAWKCEECELQFLEADKLAMHQIEKHSPELKTEQQFQCTDCRRVFISQKGLTSHRRIHHSTESTDDNKEVIQGIMCLECRKICKDITALTSHMRLHSPERKYPCKFCDFRFATPEKRKNHADIHTGDMKYVCFICEYQCSSENRLKQHKVSLKHANMKEYLLTGKPLLEEPQSPKEKAKELKKKECSVKRKRKKEKECSELEEAKESSDSSDGEVSCDICGDMFSSEQEMLEHKLTHPFIEFPNDDKPSRIFFK